MILNNFRAACFFCSANFVLVPLFGLVEKGTLTILASAGPIVKMRIVLYGLTAYITLQRTATRAANLVAAICLYIRIGTYS